MSRCAPGHHPAPPRPDTGPPWVCHRAGALSACESAVGDRLP